MDLTPEQKKQRFEKLAKYAIAGAICFVVSPFIFGVIQGMLGLIVAAGVGFTAIQLTPYFAMKVGNFRMALMTGEARRNPIETMNSIYIENMRVLQEKTGKIVQFEGRLHDFQDKMAMFAKKYPDEVQRYQTVAQQMSAVLTRQKQKQKLALQAAKEYKDQIEKAEAIYQMACEAHAVQELSGSLEKQAFQDIKKRVAFDAVTHSFNTAVAELSVEADTDPDSFMLQDTDSKQLNAASNIPQVINAEYVGESQRVRRS